MRQLKEKFVGASSWENARELYPEFAREAVLERKFKGIPFTKDMPAMINFCQKAMRYVIMHNFMFNKFY